MHRLFQPISNELHSHKWRGLSLIVTFLIIIASLQAQSVLQKQQSDRLDQQLAVELEHNSQLQLVAAIKTLQEKVDAAKAIGADTAALEKVIVEIKSRISDPTKTIENFNTIRDQVAVVETLIATQTEINRVAELQRQSGILVGVVKEGEQLLSGVSLTLTDGTTTTTTTSAPTALILLRLRPGHTHSQHQRAVTIRLKKPALVLQLSKQQRLIWHLQRRKQKPVRPPRPPPLTATVSMRKYRSQPVAVASVSISQPLT